MPLYGIIQGKPAVQDLDLNQSLALAATGMVWTYYGFLVIPRYVADTCAPMIPCCAAFVTWRSENDTRVACDRADLLIAVNVALLAVNGYNVVRKVRCFRVEFLRLCHSHY